ncbi:capsule biosynthesis protein [Salinicola avicenniae]|uniref:capsule biosynthesis protein n=1 Tax=Salinicola avicenniae TaxID=2916836 RepID=UPI002073C6E6|nr:MULTISPECIES: capsular biosynthesis protein [unclassified Salinicola]
MLIAKRAFLFLQGVCSPFFNQLAQRLIDDGHKVIKVNFNAGDQWYWRQDQAHAFRDPLPMLGDFVADLWRRHGITDQIVFGDCRPVHRDVIRAARRFGIRNHVFEEGYFRPYWITLEREGVNRHSLLPRDPDWYREVGAMIPRALPPRAFSNAFASRAAHDVAYHLAGIANPLLFRHYRRHAALPIAREYAGYVKRFSALHVQRLRDNRRCCDLLNKNRPFYLLPLQLDGDAQIRFHSPFPNMRDFLTHAVTSFAAFAPQRTRLVIKNHPLDMGLSGHARHIRELARELSLQGRLVYLESGDLDALIQHASGMVTVNSTAGHVALEQGCPTLALGQPLYHMPGLTAPGSLDDFWQHPIGPRPSLFNDYARVVIHAAQINGGFYSRQGIDLAVINAVPQLTSPISPLEQLLCASRLPVAS